MRDLPTILRAFVAKRFSHDSHLAEMLGVDRALVSRVMSGKQPIGMKVVDQWADALDLTGQERADFRLAVALANSPEEVRTKLASIEAELDATKRLLDKIEAREIKRRSALRPRR